MNLWHGVREFTRLHRLAVLLMCAAPVVLVATPPAVGAVALVTFLVIFARMSVFSVAYAVEQRRQPKALPVPPVATEPVYTVEGWRYPDGSLVDDDTYLARQIAPQIVVEPELRHPAWAAVLEPRQEEFDRAVRLYVRAKRSWREAMRRRTDRIEEFQEHTRMLLHGASTEVLERVHVLDSEIKGLRAEVIELPAAVALVGDMICTHGGGGRVMFDARHIATVSGDGEVAYTGTSHLIPDDEVIDLDREFVAATDCRVGHFAEHPIVGRSGDRVTRECRYCFPATRWTERA